MAKLTSPGLDAYIKKLDEFDLVTTERILAPAIYDAAAIMADATRAEIEALPVDGGLGTPENPLKGPNQKQKEGLLASLGITPLANDNGYYNVKIGFSGYNSIKTRTWPQGQPNALIARALIRGTSFLAANNFIKRAASAARAGAIAAMEKSVNDSMKKIMK